LKGKSVSNGSIKESFEHKGSSELCKVCHKKAMKNKVPSLEDVKELVPQE